MQEYLQGFEEQIYSVVYMKVKLKEYFGDKIVVINLYKKVNVVIFYYIVLLIISEFYCQLKKEFCEVEKVRSYLRVILRI